MSLSQPEPAPSPTTPPEGPPQASPQAARRLAGWRSRLGRVLVAVVGIVAGLEKVLIWIEPTPEAEAGQGGFNSRRAWAYLLRAARWIKAMQARLAEEGRAERAARRAEAECLRDHEPLDDWERGFGDRKRPAAEKPEADDCIVGRTDQEVMAQIFADLGTVASMLEDDDAARRLAIYQREAQALLGGPPPAAEAERRRAARGRAKAASRERERRRESAAAGAGSATAADAATVGVRAPDSG